MWKPVAPYSEHFGVNSSTGEVYLAQSVYGYPKVRYSVSILLSCARFVELTTVGMGLVLPYRFFHPLMREIVLSGCLRNNFRIQVSMY